MSEVTMTHNNEESPINGLFKNTCYYEIPFFQRNYKWKRSKIEDLTSDFDSLLSDEKSVHFMGAMIFYKEPSSIAKTQKLEVIDGQQRITSIYLFILAVTRWLVQEKHYEEAHQLFTNQLINTNEKLSNAKLHPSRDDRGQLNWIFSQIITKPFGEFLAPITYKKLRATQDSKTSGLLRENYNAFLTYIKRAVQNIEDSESKKEYVLSIVDNVLLKCTVVTLNVRDRANGPLIFDKLNASQEAMTIGELVKNGIFARMSHKDPEEISHTHDTIWLPFEKDFKNPKILDDFFFPYALIKNPNIKKNEVYNDLFKHWERLSAEEIVLDMERFKIPYLALTTSVANELQDPDFRKGLLSLCDAGIPSSTLPFLMQAIDAWRYDNIDTLTAVKIFQTLETFFVRRAVCNIEPTGLHAVFKRLWREMQPTINATNLLDTIKEISQTVEVPTDEKFREFMMTNEMYGKNITPYILLEFDKYLGGEIPADKPTIEHVLPENLTNWSGVFSLEEHKLNRHRIGNLVLLTQKLNSEASNKSFAEKKEIILGNAMFKSARLVFEQSQKWNAETIEKRCDDIATWALQRWAY